MTERTAVYVVDRMEGDVCILIPEEGEALEVPRAALPAAIGEGAVLRVPLSADGSPLWDRAQRDHDLEAELLDEGEARLDRLRKRDPGGDVVL